MKHKAVSTSSAKDDSGLVDLNDLALAMYADSLFLTDTEYEELVAMHQKRKQQQHQCPSAGAAFIAGAFLALSIAAIVIAITNWGWQ